MMAFITQHKAESRKEVVENKQGSQILSLKTETPTAIVQKTAFALTAGIDVRKVGFWFVVRAWKKALTRHLIQYGNLSTFADLKTLIFGTPYQMEGSNETMAIWRATMDIVWRQNRPGVVFVVKDASKPHLQRVRVTVIDKMASADSEWTPSLTFLAQNMRQPAADSDQETTGKHPVENSEYRSRPSWFERRR